MTLRKWKCEILVDDHGELPDGADFAPRRAAQLAIEKIGFEILYNSSGWGQEITKYDEEYLDFRGRK